MENYKYSLAKRGKSICPECNRKSFVPYIDNATGEPLHSTVGKCDRADNCGHHYSPKEYFKDNNISFDTKKEYVSRQTPVQKPQPAPSCIDIDTFKKSLSGYENNRLVQFLSGVVGDEATRKAIEMYYIGTSKYWDGSTVFWQIDGNGKIRTGKIMQYDSMTGKRIKEPVNKITWVHAALKLDSFNLKQCLFGEHLLRDATKMIAIVESEKTAVIASVYLPKFIWLACGGSEGLNIDRCRSLKGRRVALFPDARMFDKWNGKAEMLRTVCESVSVSSLIEKNATDEERKAGFDLADYLVRFSPDEFLKREEPAIQKPQSVEVLPDATKIHPAAVSSLNPYYTARRQEDWSSEIRDIETWLAETVLPTKPFQLSVCETVDNCRLFVEVLLLTAKSNNGNPTFRPYLDSVINLKNKL